MPISLSNLTQVLVWKIKRIAGEHKKKLILALVLLIGGYIAKKKLTLAHILSFVEALTKVVQALPLPQSPKMRKIADYQHPSTSPLKSILEATKLQQIKKKISRKEAGWQQLKSAITTCVILTLTLYNNNSFYFLLQNKYREQFMDLGASLEFQQAMFVIRKRFIEQIPLLFQSVKVMLSWQLQKMELTKICSVQDFNTLFQNMVEKVFSSKFDIRNQGEFSSMAKVGASARNYFVSTYEYMPEKKTSVLAKIGGGMLKLMGGVFSVGELFPQAKVQITAQRYLFTKMSYLQPLKKATTQLQLHQQFKWPNKESQELFSLLIQQIQFIVTSVNFSTLLRSYSKYYLKILRNRIALLFAQNKKNNMKVSQILPSLYKIIQEEFLKGNQKELRDRYHHSQLKKALKIVAKEEREQENVEDDVREEERALQQHILEEIELKQSFQFLQKQLQLKIYNQRSGFVMHPKSSSGNKQAEQMKRLLGMVSSGQMFSGQQ